MQETTPLNLNLQYPNQLTVMHAVQNDRLTRKITASLFDGSIAWTPPSGSAAIVRFAKPDGTMGFYDTDEANHQAVTWSGNIATIILAEQMLTVPGDVYCQINFYNSGQERLSTFTWVIKVQPNVITDETIESTDYFNILTAQINEIVEALAEVPTPSTSNPLMDGTADVGTSNKYARADHRHPSDTTRVPTTRKVNGKDLSANITLAAGDIGYNSSTTYSSATVGKEITDLKGAINDINLNTGEIYLLPLLMQGGMNSDGTDASNAQRVRLINYIKLIPNRFYRIVWTSSVDVYASMRAYEDDGDTSTQTSDYSISRVYSGQILKILDDAPYIRLLFFPTTAQNITPAIFSSIKLSPVTLSELTEEPEYFNSLSGS